MIKKAFKIAAVVIVVGIVGFFSARYYAYHGGKRDVASESAAFSVSSNAIVSEFSSNTEASNKKYLEKPVSISGTVTSIEGNAVILDKSVNCIFSSNIGKINVNDKVTIKGRVIGFDDLLGELKLDQCSIQN